MSQNQNNQENQQIQNLNQDEQEHQEHQENQENQEQQLQASEQNLDELLKNILKPIQETPPDFRCGLIAIVGRPNVGKSSFMNLLIGEKVSITSHKSQTTRHHIFGILSQDDAQMVFVDTPGFQTKYNQALNKNLNKTMTSTLTGVDVVVFIIEAKGFKEEDQKVLDILPKDIPIILLINKIDLIKEMDLFNLLTQLKDFPFAEFVPFSVNKVINKLENISNIQNNFKNNIKNNFKNNKDNKDNNQGDEIKDIDDSSASMPTSTSIRNKELDYLLNILKKYLPMQPPIYSQEQITTQSTQFLITELIREKVFRLTGDELPYQTTVIIDQFHKNSKITRVFATILVEKPAHKAMIIGENGQKIKTISQLARLDMEKSLNTKVYLELWVKVKSGWADSEATLKTYGYS